MTCQKPILIVDDDLDIREALRDTLADEGRETVAVGDGRAALEYLRRGPQPCLVLLDWNMAPMNGEQVLEAIRTDPGLAPLPVVLVTADLRAEQRAREPGIDGYLRKPLDLDALFALVEQHCG